MKPLRRCRSRFRNRRRGALTVELILVLPIVIILLCGLVELVSLLTCQQTIRAAAAVAAREASLPGATLASVRDAADRAVQGWDFGSCIELDVTAYTGTGEEIPFRSAISGDEIVVTVDLPAELASPSLLKKFGCNWSGSQLRGSYVSRKE